MFWGWYRRGERKVWCRAPAPCAPRQVSPRRSSAPPPASHRCGFPPAALPFSRPREKMLFRWTDVFSPFPRWKWSGLASSSNVAHVEGGQSWESRASGWTTMALLLPGGNLPLHFGLAAPLLCSALLFRGSTAYRADSLQVDCLKGGGGHGLFYFP